MNPNEAHHDEAEESRSAAYHVDYTPDERRYGMDAPTRAEAEADARGDW